MRAEELVAWLEPMSVAKKANGAGGTVKGMVVREPSR